MPTPSAVLDQPDAPRDAQADALGEPGAAIEGRLPGRTGQPGHLDPVLPGPPPAGLLAIFTGVTLQAVVAVRRPLLRAGCSSSPPGYHRYFAHRSYRLNRVLAVRAGLRRHDRGAEGPAVVGGAPPRPPPLQRHRARRPLADPEGLLVEPRGLDPLRQVRRPPTYDRIRTSPSTPSCVFLNKYDWIGPWALGIACYLIAGWSGLLIGFFLSTVLLWHATFTVNSLAHVHRPPPLRHRRHQPELGPHRPDHDGRGLAQQPPLLPGVGPPGLLLVGVRPQLLPAQGRLAGSASCTTCARRRPACSTPTGSTSGAFDVGMFKAYWGKASRAVAHSHVTQVVTDGRAGASDALA